MSETRQLVIRLARIHMRHAERIMYLTVTVIVYGVATVILFPTLRGDLLTVYASSFLIPYGLASWIWRTRAELERMGGSDSDA